MRKLAVNAIRIAIVGIIVGTGYSVLANRSGLCSVPASLVGSSAIAAQSWTTRKVQAVRTDAAYRLWTTPEGYIWMPGGSDELVGHLLQEQARGIYGKPVCRRGDVVLDCGAHVGIYTRQAIKDGASLVVAIEPAPENLECLRRNLAAEISAGKVIVVPKGVWDHEDTLYLANTPDNSGNDHITTDNSGVAVPLTTIDTLVDHLRLPRVDLIKMDIEGSERNALEGATATLRQFHPRLSIAAYHRSDDAEAITDIARRANPAYAVAPGNCACFRYESGRRFVPEVLFFR